MSYEIFDAEVPPRKGGKPAGVSKYPFAEMKPGQAFLVPRDGRHTNGGFGYSRDAAQNRLYAAAHNWAKKNCPSAKFAVRIHDDAHVCVYRIA